MFLKDFNFLDLKVGRAGQNQIGLFRTARKVGMSEVMAHFGVAARIRAGAIRNVQIMSAAERRSVHGTTKNAISTVELRAYVVFSHIRVEHEWSIDAVDQAEDKRVQIGLPRVALVPFGPCEAAEYVPRR